MQPRAMLFFNLFDRYNFASKASELGQFLLNCLQPFLPLTVSDLGFWSILVAKPILFIQLVNVSDFRPETPNLFPKNPNLIHIN